MSQDALVAIAYPLLGALTFAAHMVYRRRQIERGDEQINEMGMIVMSSVFWPILWIFGSIAAIFNACERADARAKVEARRRRRLLDEASELLARLEREGRSDLLLSDVDTNLRLRLPDATKAQRAH